MTPDRKQPEYYGEIKFSDLNKGLLTLYLELLTRFCDLKDASFHCFVLEKSPGWEGRFGSIDRVYELSTSENQQDRAATRSCHTSRVIGRPSDTCAAKLITLRHPASTT